MSYTKPEVVKLSEAVEAIQGVNKISTYTDNNSQSPFLATSAAYESDE
jgi:hypothetical protein